MKIMKTHNHRNRNTHNDFFDLKPVKGVFGILEWILNPKRFKIVVAIAVLFVVAGIGFTFFQTVGNETTHTSCVVTGKDRTMNTEGESQMRVYTENCGTFQITDNVFKGFWNSADVYGKIKEGETYTFKTTGIRSGFGSFFPNIYEANLTD